MKPKLESVRDISILQVSGPVTPENFSILRAGIKKLLSTGKNKIILEVPDSNTFSTPVLREMAILNLLAAELSGQIVLAQIGPLTRAKIEAFSKPPVVTCFPDRKSAIEFFYPVGSEEIPDKAPTPAPAPPVAAAPTPAPAPPVAAAPTPAPAPPVAAAPTPAPAPPVAAAPTPAPAPPVAAAPTPAPAPPVAAAPTPAPAPPVAAAPTPAPAPPVAAAPTPAPALTEDQQKDFKRDLRAKELGDIGEVRRKLSELEIENKELKTRLAEITLVRRDPPDIESWKEKTAKLEKDLSEAIKVAQDMAATAKK